jgi:hypothetical protein
MGRLACILFLCTSLSSLSLSAQSDTSFSFLVAGHAYGAHDGENTGLHPALLNSLDSGFDTSAVFIVFTGDIVNHSTADSWQQVDNELLDYGLPYYFVMGNHDNNEAGRQVFEEKFGSTFYAFHSQRALFIILNSTEEDRSISPGQLDFLEEKIIQAGDSTDHIFIFFHEILWNSHEKYTGVRSNSRSRYDQMVNYSNYWDEVHPMLTGFPDRHFYLIAGDVGGNEDAVAAFYDSWDNVTLLASGMGETPDENYLLVRVPAGDSPEFELVPLDKGFNLPAMEFFSVPPSPGMITGPVEVTPGSTGIEYSVPEVFNATSYLWELPVGLNGSGISNLLFADVDSGFTEGIISVRAERDGFGRGPAVSKVIRAKVPSVDITEQEVSSPQIRFFQTTDCLMIRTSRLNGEILTVRIFDPLGRILKSEKVLVQDEGITLSFNKTELSKGFIFISITVKSRQISVKSII